MGSEEYICNGGGEAVASVHVRTMGEGVKFLPFCCIRTNSIAMRNFIIIIQHTTLAAKTMQSEKQDQ